MLASLPKLILLSTLPLASKAITVPRSLASTTRANADGITGACTCSVTICEDTLSVQGCNSPLTFGDTSAVFCSVGDDGNQEIFYSFDDYAHQNGANIVCDGSSTPSPHFCSCSQYQGTDYGNLTVTSYSTNSAGYVTDPEYYGSQPADGPCYCDIFSQSSPEGDALYPVGYFSLGTASQPADCRFETIQVPNQEEVQCGIVSTGETKYTPMEYTCKCATSSATPTSGYPVNSTQAQLTAAPNQSLINIVLNAKNGGGTSSSSSSSSTPDDSTSTTPNKASTLVDSRYLFSVQSGLAISLLSLLPSMFLFTI